MQTAGRFIISFHCLLRQALRVSSKDGYFHQEDQLNLDVLMWVTCGSATVCDCVLPRTESPWFFTRFLPRLSSKMVSILLTYYIVEAQVLVSPIILEPLQNHDYKGSRYTATNRY